MKIQTLVFHFLFFGFSILIYHLFRFFCLVVVFFIELGSPPRLKNKHRNHCYDTYSQDERSKDAKGMFSSMPIQKIDNLGRVPVTQRVEDSIVITSILKILLDPTSDENWNVSFSFSLFRFFYSLTVNSSNLTTHSVSSISWSFSSWRYALCQIKKQNRRSDCCDTTRYAPRMQKGCFPACRYKK
jgi:hypothetical protein